MSEKNHSFQYKWEETESTSTSAIHNAKDYTLVFWLFIFFVGFLILFYLGYQKNFKLTSSTHRQIQSLHSVNMEPFLVRVVTERGLALSKVRVQFFVENILTQSELRDSKDQYKEHLIFFLSHVEAGDFLDEERKQDLTEKIKNHINSFLSTGKVHQVVIENQFLEEGIVNG